MDRRTFLLSASAFALPIPSGDALHFRVFRNGSPVGDHHTSFSQSGDDLTVTTAVRVVVTIAMIPVFRYGANATERWRDGVFQSVDSNVNSNGTLHQVNAVKTAAGYDVQGTNVPRYTAPPDTLPLTYWNKTFLNGTILNIQTAHSYQVKVVSPGWYKLPTADNSTVISQRFDVSGKLNLSVWYDQNNAWSGLEFQRSGDFSYQKYIS
jgi:hypothetical protein